MPLTAFLLAYGFEVYSLWIRPSFAQESAYLLPILLLGNTAMFGQFNSVSILFGMGRHKTYSWFLLAESLLTALGLMVVLPRYGLWGGAWLVSLLMLLNRAVLVCLLASRELGINALEYAARIYTMPTALGTGAFLLLMALKRSWIPGRTWGQVVLAAMLMGIPYALLTYRFSLAGHHREMVRGKALSLLAAARRAVARAG